MARLTLPSFSNRAYKPRPTRTQILNNPKLRTQLTESIPVRTEAIPKCVESHESDRCIVTRADSPCFLLHREGTAAAILAANEAKRAAKLAAAKKGDRSDSGSSSASSSSGSSSSGSSSSGSESESGSGSESESESDDGGKSRRRSGDRRSRSPRRRSRSRSRNGDRDAGEKRRRIEDSPPAARDDRKGKGRAVERD